MIADRLPDADTGRKSEYWVVREGSYYFDISPDKDATLSPTFSTKDKAQFDGEYRERFDRGMLQLDGSFTRADLISDTGPMKAINGVAISLDIYL